MKLTRAERDQLVDTLRRAKAEGSFDSALVREIAGSVGVSERYLYSLNARRRAGLQAGAVAAD